VAPEQKSRPCSDRNGLPTETFRILVAQEAIAKSKACAVARIRLSDPIDTLSEEIPADLWQSSFEWARKRTG
jgi:hypothetical protein